MAYTPYLWKNLPDETTPISAENLNHMEQGIADAHSLAADLETDKANEITSFTEASERANIASGETITVILGKIKKFFTDLKTVAFSGSYEDLSDQPTIPEIDDTTTSVSDLWSSSKTSDELADKMSYGDSGILGAKNWLNHKITSRVVNGITVTINANTKAITLNGTATEDSQIQENVRDIFLSKGTYQYSGALNSDDPIGDINEYFTYLNHINNVSSWKARSSGTVEERQFTITDDSYGITFGIYIAQGAEVNLTFYPMIRLVSDTDTTYQPYSMTNKQLTEEVREIESNSTENITVTSDYGTVNLARLMKIGKLKRLYMEITVSSSVPALGEIATLPNNAKPTTDTVFDLNDSSGLHSRSFIGTSGIITTSSAINSGVFAIIDVVYY